jgi:hypothetical protein
MPNNDETTMRVTYDFKDWIKKIKVHESQPDREIMTRLMYLLGTNRKETEILKEKLNGIKI